MCSTDGDSVLVWQERDHVARKRYTCIECHLPIPIGVKYTCISGVSAEHTGFRDRAHVECMELWHSIHNKECDNDGLIELGGLEIEVENLDEVYAPEPNPRRITLDAIRAKYRETSP